MPDFSASDIQAASSPEGLQQLLARLGYDVSDPVDQTAASLGVAERVHHMIRRVRRLAAERPAPGMEIYWFEATALTADLRKTVAGAFRNKPANALLLMTTRDFDPLDFVLVAKSLVQTRGPGGQVAISHQLFSVDRRNPSPRHVQFIGWLRRYPVDPYAQFDRIRDAFERAEWSEEHFNNRNLFSDYYLKHRLPLKDLFPVWHEDCKPARQAIGQVAESIDQPTQLDPADYASRFIEPLLAALGFDVQRAASNAEVDYLLRPQGASKDSSPCAGLLAYPWDRPLDRKDDVEPPRDRTDDVPGIRIVRAMEQHKLPWAILTNGKAWRLYCAQAHSRASNYYEVELPAALEGDNLIAFRYFYLFFRAKAFVGVPSAREPSPSETAPACFLDRLRVGSEAFAKELGDRLRGHVFNDVFPYLAQGFVDDRKLRLGEQTRAGDAFLNEVYDGTLTLLYRLLFLLYAESLDLLPVHEPAYAALGLDRLKREVKEAAGNDADAVEKRLKDRFSRTETGLYGRLLKLFEVIDKGSKQHNVPAYNGGLFETAPDRGDASREAAAARFLKTHRVGDYYLARALDLLARNEDDKTHELVFVDYKAMGVRQLGSIYEGLLMYHVVIPRDDWEKKFQRPGLKVALVPSNKERKSTGSYFTPQHIVKYIVANTVGPLLAEKFEAIAPKVRDVQREYAETRQFERKRAEKMGTTPRTDDAIAEDVGIRKHQEVVWDLFDLKVLDPAMGSGHFLVETVDFITDKVLDFLAGFPWNPVQVVIEHKIRRQILESLDTQGVTINAQRLTDVNLIKRLVMKRCVYGVDLNPMAVELAKVSLWLDSFTLGAPLSFLDHHLKCGNSLIGSTIADLKKAVAESGSLFAIPMEPLERATRNMETIADLTDATLTEVSKSADTYSKVLSDVKGYRVLLDCLTAQHFGVPQAADIVVHAEALGLRLDDWDRSLAKAAADKNSAKMARTIDEARRISDERRFFHWDLDFPDVFFSARRQAQLQGFDAVLGNPPWGADLDKDGLSYVKQAFRWTGSQRDTYIEMTEQGHRRLRPAGCYGMILPDAWLTGRKYEPFRQGLLGVARPVTLVDLPYDTFPEAYVDCAILTTIVLTGAGLQGSHKVRAVKFDNNARVPESFRDWPYFELPLNQWLETPHRPFSLANESEARIMQAFADPVHPFSEVAVIDRGLEAYGQHTPKEIRRARGHHSDKPRGKKWIPQLSGELRRYKLLEAFGSYVNLGAELAECPPVEFFEGERLLIRRMISRQYRIMAAVAHHSFAVDSSTLIAKVNRPGIGCHALLTLVNSALFSFSQVSRSNIAQRDDYPKISLYEARSWPLPSIGSRYETPGKPKPEGPTPAPSERTVTIAEEELSGAALAAIVSFSRTGCKSASLSSESGHTLLNHLGKMMIEHAEADTEFVAKLSSSLQDMTESRTFSEWAGATQLDDLDYLGWEGRYPSWSPDDRTLADGRWYPNGVAPPIPGSGPGDIPWDLIARVYPSYPLPGIDEAAWEAAAWEQFCDLLRKNKTKIGNTRIKADLTGRGAITNPTGPMRKLQEVFLKYHREIRANRAKAAEIDFLIDRIVFRLFDLTLEEQKLILSRVGPGRPLPPRRGRRRKAKAPPADAGPGLFE